ncbi:MAG: hypothetical protein LUE17_07145, partial [Planctomycetaceae bacterium]|nr:hypothetical protein [Planctomycetaceae bacterium]
LQKDPSAQHVRYNSTHLSGLERKMNLAGCCWPIPVQFRENPKAYSDNRDELAIMMLQVCPMDSSGNFNMGLSVAEYNGLLENVKTVIVEVNPNMPRVMGSKNYINLAQVDYVVEGSASPIPTISGNISASEVEQKMAEKHRRPNRKRQYTATWHRRPSQLSGPAHFTFRHQRSVGAHGNAGRRLSAFV